MVAAVETMAYNKVERPWHGLGVPVNDDLTPRQMLEAAGLDWEVELVPNFATYKGKKIKVETSTLFRESDGKILSARCSDDWNPVQNQEAADFFNDFCAAGEMTKNLLVGTIENTKVYPGKSLVAINLKSAAEIGLKLTPEQLQKADKVIP